MATPTIEVNEIRTNDISNYQSCKDLNEIRLNVDDITINFDSWQVDMENYLKSQDLLGIVDGREPRQYLAGSEQDTCWLSKDIKALEAIKMACGPNIPALVKFAFSSADAWTSIRSLGEGDKDYGSSSETDLDNEDALAPLSPSSGVGLVIDHISIPIKKRKKDHHISIDDIKRVQRLHRYNYDSWMFNMENYLRNQDLWCVVKINSRKKYRAWNQTKIGIAHEAIRKACGAESQDRIRFSKSAQDAWSILSYAESMTLKGRLRDVAEFLKRLQGNTMGSDAGSNLKDGTLLTPNNYRTWKNEMRVILTAKGQWECVKRPGDEYTSHRDAKAYETIRKYCGLEMLPHIMYTECPKEAWTLLAQADAASHKEKERYNKILAAAKTPRFISMDDVIKASNGLGYNGFKVNIKEYLTNLYLWDIVGGTGNELPTIHNLSTWRNKNKVALEIIRTCCPMVKKHLIYRSNFAEEAWYKLAEPANLEDLELDTLEEDPQTRFLPIADHIRKDEPICGFARTFLDAFPKIMSDRFTLNGMTLLHYVILSGKLNFGKDLLDMMSSKQLRKKTDEGNAAISLAVEANNIEMVKLMVCKNSKLLLKRNEHGHIPLITSAINGDEEMLRYLFYVTPMEDKFSKELSDKDGATLITAAIRVEIYDIALKLLKLFPRLATTQDDDGMTVIDVLAGKPSAFPSGIQFGIFQRGIYQIAGVGSCGLVGKALKITVPYLKKLHDKKKKHNQVAEIVDIICTGIADFKLKQLTQSRAFDAVSLTIIHGIVELFTALIKSNDSLMQQRDKDGNGLFQLAVLHRQENVFKAMIDMGIQRTTTAPIDKDKNNILHCAGFWRPLLHLNKVSGAALQMQREIQWFKEVQKVVKPKYREMENRRGIKPEALFTQQHENLVREGEKWVKEASQACMVVSTLIATVMFAAAFTVPGGNNQTTGQPMFLKSGAFLFFIVSDAVSLFASCTSVLMFFTLLTTRYAEPDFLTSLPTKLILGLLFLFISIATMLATFGATLVIVLHDHITWVYIPVIVLASIPVVLFGSLQFPLFVEILMSTYGRGIFHRTNSGFFYNTMRRVSTWCVNNSNKLYTFFLEKEARTKTL